MTVINISMRNDRAIVATDSLMYEWSGAVLYGADGVAQEHQKLYALPHAQAALVVRGASLLATHVLVGAFDVHSFEAVVEHATQALRAVADADWLRGEYKGKPRMHTVYLVGWSELNGRVELAEFEYSDGFVPRISHVSGTGQRGIVDPYVSGETGRLPDDVATMEAAVMRHLTATRKTDPTAPFGGRLQMALISAAGVTLVAGCGLGLPEPIECADESATEACAIAANAATETVSDRSTSLTYSFTAGAGFPYRVQRFLQINWTNTTGEDVTVELSAEIGGTKSSGPGSVWLDAGYQAGSAMTSASYSSLTPGYNHTDCTAGPRRYTSTDHLTVAPGATIYFTLTAYINTTAGTTTVYAGDGRLRIVAVKK
jgi:hypothetical protein